MKEDEALTPGSKAFWNDFYNKEDGRLIEKEKHYHKNAEVKEGGSLLNHYEWFLSFASYGSSFLTFLEEELNEPARSDPECHVLHIGCGNSDFCEHFSAAAPFHSLLETKKNMEVLNVDICESIIDHLSLTFPERLYAVGDCCQMKPNEDSLFGSEVHNRANEFSTVGWYHADRQRKDFPLFVQSNSTHIIFDKGSLDAILSAFPGEFNPNAHAYAEEAIRVIMVGGIFYIISINATDVIDSYILSVSEDNKSFRRVHHTCLSHSSNKINSIRTETLGSIYHCYGYLAVTEDA